MQESRNPKETETTTGTAWIFDIDGVITDPTEKQVKEPEILNSIYEKLKKNEPVAFNTGRSISWLNDRVINPLLEIVEDKELLDKFVIVAEKGGVWMTFDKKGSATVHKDELSAIPQSLRSEIQNTVEQNFIESMFFDSSKEIISTIEMNNGYELNRFKKDQKILVEELKSLIKTLSLQDSLNIDATTIATDVESKHLGKGFSVERILELFAKKSINPNQFIAFGDSPSDIEMAEKLHEKNLTFTFIFVDDRGRLEGLKKPYPIIYTSEKFDKGTMEYLNRS